MKNLIKGKCAVGSAISFFSLRGMVSVPLEGSSYNLIYDDGISLLKIKVVSCSYKNANGVYTANIRSMGGNMPKMTTKLFEPDSCDYVFVLTENLEMYNIPSEEIKSARSISLNVYAQYRVNFGDVV
jgi:hypothetical protein